MNELIIKVVLYILIFFAGASIGSFIAAIVSRSKQKKGLHDLLFDNSKCDKCKQDLFFFDLIPLLSFLVLKGKCRKCKDKISPSFLLIEIISGATLVIQYLMYEIHLFSFDYFIYSVLISVVFLVLSYYDYLYWEVPISFIVFVVLIYSLFIIFIDFNLNIVLSKFVSSIVGMLLIGSIMFISNWKGLGWGDVWVFGLLGLVFGWKNLIVIFILSIVIGGFWVLINLLIKNNSLKKKKMVQFVPFIGFAAILVLLDSKYYIFNKLFPIEMQWYWFVLLFVVFILSTYLTYNWIKGKLLK